MNIGELSINDTEHLTLASIMFVEDLFIHNPQAYSGYLERILSNCSMVKSCLGSSLAPGHARTSALLGQRPQGSQRYG